MKYFKANFSNHFPGDVEPDAGPRPGFCVMITANKKSRHPLELYSERTRTVRWFEANHPERFDLYGIGWNRNLFEGPAPVRLLNRVGPLTRLLAEKYPSYRGTVDEKLPVLRKYKYSVCYENARDIPGYITEKIFDSMFAGCVPVYWGAPDISRHVPEDCFIDRRKFSSHEALYKYLDGLPGPAYAKMREAMRAYVKSAGAGPFSDAYYARTVCGRISE